MPSNCCIAKLTKIIPIQQRAPSTIAFPPCEINFLISVLSPIADIAIIIKNFDKNFIVDKKEAGSGSTVVKIDASRKNKMNVGKEFNTLTFSVFSFDFIIPSTSVIGIIARVLVNFTIVA